jgi:hypothetical protein
MAVVERAQARGEAKSGKTLFIHYSRSLVRGCARSAILRTGAGEARTNTVRGAGAASRKAKTYQSAKTRQVIAPVFGGPQPIDPAANLFGSVGAADCPVAFREEIQRSVEADLRLRQHAAGRSLLRSRAADQRADLEAEGLVQVFGPEAKLTRKVFALHDLTLPDGIIRKLNQEGTRDHFVLVLRQFVRTMLESGARTFSRRQPKSPTRASLPATRLNRRDSVPAQLESAVGACVRGSSLLWERACAAPVCCGSVPAQL